MIFFILLAIAKLAGVTELSWLSVLVLTLLHRYCSDRND